MRNISPNPGQGGEYRDGFYHDYSASGQILEWLADRRVWRESSRMREKRFNHAVSTVSRSSGILEHCSLDSSERTESNRESILDFINEANIEEYAQKYKQGPRALIKRYLESQDPVFYQSNDIK